MLVNPLFARWITTGLGKDARDDEVPDGRTPTGRFAAYEQVVAGRTNGLLGPRGGLQLPWPRALGTPPWGALAELESITAAPSGGYQLRWTRTLGSAQMRAIYTRLRERVGEDRPALLYVGNAWLPRHVVLAVQAPGSRDLAVYEPASGLTLPMTSDRFVGPQLDLAGWNVMWAILWPSGH